MTTLLNETLKQQSIYMPTPARIVAMKRLTDMEMLFTMELPSGFSLAHDPGQFVQVSVFGIGEAPISISSSPSRSQDTFEICVRRVGNVTNAMHKMKVGDMVGVRGPFGRGFPVEPLRGKDILFCPGGLGMAPLRSLINEVLDQRGHFGRIIMMYGARSPQDILFKDEIAAMAARDDIELHLTVDKADENWKGNVGVITTLFPPVEVDPRNTVAIVCGPPVMYRFVLKELMQKKILDGNIWLSFERHMKCGVGKCGHCQMHHIYTCQDGPVFPYQEIKHLEEAL